MDRTVT